MATQISFDKKTLDAAVNWFNSLSGIRKYSLLAMLLGFVLLILAIILW